MTVQRIACIGECMVEMRERGSSQYDMGFGGDSANTAVYLSRLLGDSGHITDYITALGDDPYSDEMFAFLSAEGVGMDHAQRLSGRMPGLYFIRTDENGERTFHYYRSAAAARDMFRGESGAALLASLAGYDWIYLTGISLSILDDTQRRDLMAALNTARQNGAKVVFDGNYRPLGWPNVEAARETFSAILGVSDLALVTFSDEQVVHGDASPADAVARLRRAGVQEGAVKLDDEGCLVFDANGETVVPVEKVVSCPVDTTAAGDSFNAAYLAARICGHDLADAGAYGNRLAGTVIQHKGAVIAQADMPDLGLATSGSKR